MMKLILWGICLIGIWVTALIYFSHNMVLEAIFFLLLGIFCMMAKNLFTNLD